jgi:hypothetical protein
LSPHAAPEGIHSGVPGRHHDDQSGLTMPFSPLEEPCCRTTSRPGSHSHVSPRAHSLASNHTPLQLLFSDASVAFSIDFVLCSTLSSGFKEEEISTPPWARHPSMHGLCPRMQTYRTTHANQNCETNISTPPNGADGGCTLAAPTTSRWREVSSQ